MASFYPPGLYVDPASPVNWRHPLNRGLVGWWAGLPNPGWSGGVTLRDLVRGGRKPNDGTLTNGPTWVSGPNGLPALAFDGFDDAVTVPDSLSLQLTGPFTLSATVYLRVGAAFRPIIAKELQTGSSSGYYLGMNGTTLYFGVNAGANEITRVVSTGVWYRVVGTFNGSGLVIYIDGTQVATGGNSTAPGATSDALSIGRRTQTGTINAVIADVRVYSRALSAGQVAALYQQSKLGHPNTLRWLSTRVYFGTQGGASSLSRTAADSPLTSSTLTRLFTGSRTNSDSSLTSSTVTRAFIGSRTTSDSPLVSDTVTRAFTGTRTTSDSPLTSSAVTRVFTGSRTNSDSPITTDSLARAFTGSRTNSDAPLTSDAITRSFVGSRSISDSPSTLDALTRVFTGSRTTSDSPLVSDSIIRAFTGSRTNSDSSTTSDSLTRVFIGTRTTSDSSISSDTANRTLVELRTANDSSSTSDAVVGVLPNTFTCSDSPTVSDIVSRLFVGQRTALDAPFVTSLVNVTGGQVITVEPFVIIYLEAHPSTITRFTGTSSDPGGVIEGNTKGNIIRLGKK